MKPIKHVLILSLILFASASDGSAEYCLRSEVVETFYIYDSSDNKIASVGPAGRVKVNPTTIIISSCSNGKNNCSEKDDNYTLSNSDKHCYLIGYDGGYFKNRIACWSC